MEIRFTKLSDQRHRVAIRRDDGTGESIELESRSFLRHDLAHYAVETVIPIRGGFWGCVASGNSLTGDGIAGDDASLAESLAGPIQTLMRLNADVDHYLGVLTRFAPEIATAELAAAIHERIRQLRGRWQATPYGASMELSWPPDS